MHAAPCSAMALAAAAPSPLTPPFLTHLLLPPSPPHTRRHTLTVPLAICHRCENHTHAHTRPRQVWAAAADLTPVFAAIDRTVAANIRKVQVGTDQSESGQSWQKRTAVSLGEVRRGLGGSLGEV
jgi:hypothetical protein